jgi:hypothetical protein
MPAAALTPETEGMPTTNNQWVFGEKKKICQQGEHFVNINKTNKSKRSPISVENYRAAGNSTNPIAEVRWLS